MANTNASFESAAHTFPILVHSHLSWDWVWQRPQQFMSRLAGRHPVLFVETHGPSPDLPAPRASLYRVDAPNVFILRVQFPCSMWENGALVDRERRRLVQEAINTFLPHFRQPVQWFYDPMAVTAFAGQMNERANVYDCMDELAKFKGAPPNSVERERELLRVADVVFTGGRKLYESKSRHNSNTWFYGCGVDVAHFAQATLEDTPIAKDVASIPGPRLGYIGVVDERLDYDLLDYLARKEPDWHFLIVGPAIKVDPASFPRHENLHWLGGRDYSQLPYYAKAFDSCLMPFALNEATEYINPTKTLEYMATRRPIVSTPVADVISNFSDVVDVAATPEAFHLACKAALENRDTTRLQRGVEMAHQHTWEHIVERLEQHVIDVIQRPPVGGTPIFTTLSNGHHQPSLVGKRS